MIRVPKFKISEYEKNLIYIFVLFTFTCILIFYIRKNGLPFNSDEVGFLPMADDFFAGNFFLKEWHLATVPYLLPAIELWVAMSIFGYRDGVIYIVSAVNWSLLICLVVWQVLSYAEKYKVNKYFFATMTWLLISIPIHHLHIIVIEHILYIAASIMIFSYFNSLRENTPARIVPIVIALAVVSALVGATDMMFIYSCVIPVFFCAVVFWNQDNRFAKICLTYSSLSFVLTKLVEGYWIYKREGMSLGRTQAVFISSDQLGESILEAILSIGRHFYINMWGQKLFSYESIQAIIGLIILLFLINKLRLLFQRSDYHDCPAFVYFCLSMAAVNLLANVFGSVGLLYKASWRSQCHVWLTFYIGFVFSGMFAWIYSDRKNMGNHNRIYTSLAIGFLLFWSMAGYSFLKQDIGYPVASASMRFETSLSTATNHLIANGLTDGYGDYWLCSTAEYQGKKTNKNLSMTPFIMYRNRVYPVRIVTKESNVRKRKNFYLGIYDSNSDWYTSEEVLLNNLGQWKEKKEFGNGVVLYVWDKPFLANSARPFESLKSKMSVFTPKDNKVRPVTEKELELAPGEGLYGPVIELPDGRHSLRIDMISNGAVNMYVMEDACRHQIKKFDVANGVNHCEFTLDSYTKDIEFVIKNDSAENIIIRDLYLEDPSNSQSM